MKMEQSIPKRWHIKLRRRWIVQKKAHNIQNTAKVWNKQHQLVAQCLLFIGHCYPPNVVVSDFGHIQEARGYFRCVQLMYQLIWQQIAYTIKIMITSKR
jgi:hypothetical protein